LKDAVTTTPLRGVLVCVPETTGKSTPLCIVPHLGPNGDEILHVFTGETNFIFLVLNGEGYSSLRIL
jgi:hypothetical protein